MGGVAMVPGRGRKPKPTKQKQLAGNPGKRALNNNEPEFTKLTKVDAPTWMPELAIGMWETIVPDLLANDVLTVRGEYGEILLPFIDQVVIETDLVSKRMLVDPLEGLAPDVGN